MKTKALKQGLTAFNLLVVATFMVLALYSAIGQQIFPYIGQYRIQLEEYLSDQLNGQVSIRQLNGDMEILTPSVHVEGITLYTDDDPNQAKISIAAIDAVLDSRSSLINFTPVFKSVRLSGLYVRVDGDANKPQQPMDEDDALLIKRLIDGLLLQQHVELNNVTIENTRGGESKILHFDHLVMTGDGFNRLITGNVSYGSENKVNAGIRLYSQGSPFKLESFYARGALDLPDVDVDYWLNEIFDMSVFKEFTASAQLRFEFKNGLLNYGKLSVASPTVYINDGRKVDNVSAELWSKQNAVDNWSFWVQDSQFTLKNKPWQFSEVAVGIAKTMQGNRWQTYLKSMDIAYLHQFLNSVSLIPDNLKPLLSELNPSGYAQNMNVIMHNNSSGKLDFTVAGELKNVSTQPSGGIPGVTNLNGIIAASEKNGRVQFNGPQISLAFPGIYETPFFFPYGEGQVDWHIEEQGLRLVGNGLSLTMEQVEKVKGGFKVWLYNDDRYDDQLELNLSLKNADLLAHEVLVPSILSQDLRQWLGQSLLSGNIKDAQYYLYTGLSSGSSSQSELHLRAAQGALQYLPQWPVVSNIYGDLFVQNDHVYAQLKSGSSLGGDLNQTQIVFDGVKQNTLWVESEVDGPANDAFAYFQHTPLKDVVDNIMLPWSMTGTHKTRLALSIPLSGDLNTLGVDVKTDLINAGLNLQDIGLEFEQSNGQISYRNSEGLTSSKISTQLWQKPVALNITSKVHPVGFSSDIAFNGNVELASLQNWLELSLLNPLSGSADVSGHFKISAEDNGFTGLQLQSDLKGVEVALPHPYFKDKPASQPFNLKMALKEGQQLSLSYGELVNVALHVQQGSLKKGQVYLGATEAYLPSMDGLEVLGHVSSIDASAWLDTWKRMSPKNNTSTNDKNIIRKVDVSTDKLIYDDYIFEQVSVDINGKQNGWDVYLEAPVAKGLITWVEQKPILLDLDYIHWPALSDDTEKSGAEKEDVLASIYPSMFPDVDFKVEEIFLGPRNYGKWQAKLRRQEHSLSLIDIDGRIKKLNVKGDVHWIKHEGANHAIQRTSLDLKLSSDDIGGVQKAWMKKPVIEAKNTKVALNFNWPGSPAMVSSEVLTGQASVSLKDGRFLDAGDTGALSAFGILNFGAIGRRLRLDFSDVYQSGLHFDSVSGKAKLNNGLMTIIDTLDIKGPSAKFAASGTVNLNTKELNQELSVTFPLTSTLPFVAILAGFAPPVAASIFVGEQLVGDQIEKYTSATYKLDGKWDEPNLQIMKRFDNKIEGKQDQGFWYRMKDFFGLGDN